MRKDVLPYKHIVVTKMMNRYEELLETSKFHYIRVSHNLEDYFNNIETHYKYMREFIATIYVFNYMSDEEFNTWSDKVFNLYLQYQHFAFEQ